MTKFSKFQLLIYFLPVLFGCSGKQSGPLPSSSELEVKWELVTNMYQGKTRAMAAFTIYNHSKMTLGNRGWEMFFSQMPAIPIIEDSVRSARVEHINGDWFKLIPSKTFKLLPGDSIRINYVGTGFLIKKTDAALGMYFVFYDSKDKEIAVVPVGKQIIGEFTRPEQLKRSEKDETVVPTAESRYAENLALSLLPDNQQMHLVPSPVSIQKGSEAVVIDNKWPIFYGEGLDMEANYLSKKLKEISGQDFSLQKGLPDRFPAFSLQTGKIQSTNNEAYELTADAKKGLIIHGQGAAGVFYAIQSFLATLPPVYGQPNNGGKSNVAKSNGDQFNGGQSSAQSNSSQSKVDQSNGSQSNGNQSNGGKSNGSQSNVDQSNGSQSNGGKSNVGHSNVAQSNGGQANVDQSNGGKSNNGQNNVGQNNVGQSNGGQNTVDQSNRDQNNVGQSNVGQNNVDQSNRGQNNVGQSNGGQNTVDQSNRGQIQTSPLRIIDEPRFAYRGLHFDMSRNFQTKTTIFKMLDIMAFYKLNHFLFYFMEDEGWRVEIPGLPELTQIGSRRLHGKMSDPILHPSYGSGPVADAKNSYGSGHFTSEEFVEMLKYAKERHITVIPMINFPAHVRSAIKSMEYRYQKLMKEGKEAEANEFRLIDPEDTSKYVSAQGYKDNVVCVGRESVYHFYDTAVKGIKQMYEKAGVPMEIFHTGGDEVADGCWDGSPMVKKLLSEHPEIKPDEKSLQAYCFRRISAILKDNGVKDIGGWEEAALLTDDSGKPTPNFEFVGQGLLPYLWNNMEGAEDLGYKLANAGYKVVLCDVSNTYLDFPYDKDPLEPGNYWAGFLDTKQVYSFAPFDLFKTTTKTAMGRLIDTDTEYRDKVRLKPEARKNILGVQAQIWSETIKGEEMLEYYYLPRLIAFAETAWSPERKWETNEIKVLRDKQLTSDWNKLANVLAARELPRLASLNGGYNFRVPLPGAVIKEGMLFANVEFPGLEIRYTTDGSEPTMQSQLFTEPVKVSGTVKLKSFVRGGRSGRTSTVK